MELDQRYLCKVLPPLNADNKKISWSSFPSYSAWFWSKLWLATTSSGSTLFLQSGQVAQYCCNHWSKQSLWNVCLQVRFLTFSPSWNSDKHTLQSMFSAFNLLVNWIVGFFSSMKLRYWAVEIGRVSDLRYWMMRISSMSM